MLTESATFILRENKTKPENLCGRRGFLSSILTKIHIEGIIALAFETEVNIMRLVKLIAVMLAIASLLSLSACSSSGNAEGGTTVSDITTADPADYKVIVNVSFVEVNSETGSEYNLFGIDNFEVAGASGDVNTLDVLKQFMEHCNFEYVLTSDKFSLHRAMNLENNSEKYWTCVVDEGSSLIEVENLGNAFNAAYVSDGDTVVFKYKDRP